MISDEKYNKLEKILERTISFINSCDTKASIIMTMLGIIITVMPTVFVGDIFRLKGNAELFKNSVLFYLIFAGISMLLMLASMIMLIIVLFARIRSRKDSLMFFVSISGKEMSEYENEINKTNENELLVDLIKQIYANSIICTKKYRFFNISLLLFFSGVVCMIVDIVIRLFIV